MTIIESNLHHTLAPIGAATTFWLYMDSTSTSEDYVLPKKTSKSTNNISPIDKLGVSGKHPQLRSNKLPELEIQYGSGGIKRKGFGNNQDKHLLSFERETEESVGQPELVGEDEDPAYDLPGLVPKTTNNPPPPP